MIKKIFFQIHWFLGITAGLILSLMGITGAIYSYDQQILKWINQDSYVVTAQAQPKLTPAQLYQHFIQQDNNLKINSITVTPTPTESSSINIAKEGERRGKNIMVNPYNAEILPEIKGRDFFMFIMQLHRNLTVGQVGKQITGACTLMLIFFVLSGIYLRWPKKHTLKQWLFVKPKLKGRNFIWDLHAVVGTWVIVFYLIFAVTGLYWSYEWWRNGMFKVLGVERPQPMQMQPGNNRTPANVPNPNIARGERPRIQANTDHSSPAAITGNQRTSNSMQSQQNRGNSQQQDKQQLSSVEMINALDLTWAGFNQKIQREYSSVTLNLPKNNQGKIELSFFDLEQQHDRARNSAIYNYQDGKLEKVILYADKKLNEKIMSSMLPVHRGNFFGPVYHFIAALASLAMPLFFITGWMLYLKRRRQKKLTLAARAITSTALPFDTNTEKWAIIYATQTGMAEQVAYNTSTSLQQAGIATEVIALKDVNVEKIQQLQQILFVVSTYGTGEAPDLATGFVKKYMHQQVDFSQVKCAVLAMGSQEYAETYCLFGHQLYHWLKQNQAQPIFDVIEVDNGSSTDLENWFTQLARITQQDVHAVINEKVFDDWLLISRSLLNANSVGEPAYEVCLKPLNQQIWQAGDIAEIQPGNSLERIEQFIQTHQLNTTEQLMNALRYKDLSQNLQVDCTQSDWITQLDQLPSREYSIASLPEQGQLQLVVRQKQYSQDLGLGSGWLTAHAELQQNIPVRIRTNSSFHLITDNRPAIFMGNGTGIAGLLSLLKQREQLGFHQNWLIFGERHQAVDYFYHDQIELWLQQGHLQHVDLAFSRDQEQRIYVQHKIREQEQRLKVWLDEGAVIYICGSIEGMATGVDEALNELLGEAQVDELRQNDRYRRDVY
ncbi:hypothetical protein F4V57_05580 [Acinetobacter qingfengensis]|uniref:Uncharacterized protein n=1 Tax=Acinetobacter qingfengensis TaxID=1262585 RepID=A0A1E7RDH2_9GAMM|nr:sulfite reductase flavoprotein subunit alpha [Acinetobacter qingfengensis]KAA8734431.1 hypothetical protein F4V57_05580 [Acinetobacter qingfengensis]OEY97343.1 hypothetical protein BJI46_10145 [Acinetobacter qingfengensis]